MHYTTELTPERNIPNSIDDAQQDYDCHVLWAKSGPLFVGQLFVDSYTVKLLK